MRKISKLKLIGIGVLLLLFIHPLYSKEKAEKEFKKVNLTYQNTSCKTVLSSLAKQAGINLFLSKTIQTPITLHLANVPWTQALKVIAKLAKLKIIRLSPRLFRLRLIPTNLLELNGADIKLVLSNLARKAGYNFAISSSVVGKVTLTLKNFDYLDAFKTIVKTAGYKFLEEGRILQVLTQGEAKSLATHPSSFIKPSLIPLYNGNKKISIQVKKLTFQNVFKLIGSFTGLNIFIDPQIKGTITLNCSKLSVRNLIKIILQKGRLKAKYISSNVFEITKPRIVSMEFQQSNLSTLLDLLSRQAGINIIYPYSIKGKLSVIAKDMPYRKALKLVVETGGYKVVEIRGNVFCIIPRDKSIKLFKRFQKKIKYLKSPEKYSKVSLDVKNKTLIQILNELSKKTSFSYSIQGKISNKISLKIKKASLVAIFEILSKKLYTTFKEVKPGVFYFTNIPPISMKFENANINVVIGFIGRQASKNILISNEISGRISLNFRDLPWIDGLKAIALVSGYKIIESKKGIISLVGP